MMICKKISEFVSRIETGMINFLIRRAGKWATLLNRQVEDEVTNNYLDMVKKCEDAGNDWNYEKMSPLIDEMRKFRAENIKFAFGHVLSTVAIVFSVIANVISIIK